MPLEIIELTPSTSIKLWNRVLLTVEPANHSVDALCARIEYNNTTLGYSGDTSACDGLLRILSEVDLAIIECSYSGLGGKRKSHLTAPEVGELAKRAGVKRLLLTHRLPFASDEQLLHEVRQQFLEHVELAAPGQIIKL